MRGDGWWIKMPEIYLRTGTVHGAWLLFLPVGGDSSFSNYVEIARGGRVSYGAHIGARLIRS